MEKITLEMVDEVINRTGASYKEAKDALEFCDGDILDAVVYIETQKEHGRDFKREFSDRTNEMIEKAKELIKKGNVTRCIIEKDGRVMIDIPVNAGGLAALVFIGPTLVAVTAAIAVGCQLKIVKDNGEVINVNDLVNEQLNTVKEKVDEFKERVQRDQNSDCDCDSDSGCRSGCGSNCESEDGCGCESNSEDKIVEAKFMEPESNPEETHK